MASSEPDARTTRWLPRWPADTQPQPPDEPFRRPRFDRPPPVGNDWYGAPPDYAGPPPVEERPRHAVSMAAAVNAHRYSVPASASHLDLDAPRARCSSPPR